MAVQQDYNRPESVDPRAEKLEIEFVTDAGVAVIDPIRSHPDHKVLLALRSRVTHRGPVLVRHRGEGLDGRKLLAMRPEDARKLARQLYELYSLNRS